MTIVDLGTRIRRAREARSLKQSELAALVGVSTTTVRNWEKGLFSPRNSIGRVEEALGVSLSEDDDATGGGVALRDASDAQILAELHTRLLDRAAKLAAAGLDDPNVLPGPWAARPRRPAPPDPDENEDKR